MSDGPEWFEPTRYGYGTGLPIAWQGWALIIGFMIFAAVMTFLFAYRPLILFSILVPVTALLMFIAARTTKGGWRWRWGDKK